MSWAEAYWERLCNESTTHTKPRPRDGWSPQLAAMLAGMFVVRGRNTNDTPSVGADYSGRLLVNE